MLIEMNVMVREVWVHPLNDLRPEKRPILHFVPRPQTFPKKVFWMYRMSVQKFSELLEMLEPSLKKAQSNFRSSISPEQRLVLTFRYVLSY